MFSNAIGSLGNFNNLIFPFLVFTELLVSPNYFPNPTGTMTGMSVANTMVYGLGYTKYQHISMGNLFSYYQAINNENPPVRENPDRTFPEY